MAGTTIAKSTTIASRLTAATQNDVVVTSAGRILASGGYAIYATAVTQWRITNHGGLFGGGDGIALGGGGTVTNTGTISGRGDAGVSMRAGGSVANAGGIAGGFYGVVLDRSGDTGAGSSGSVTNTGTIGASAATGAGIALGHGGAVSNSAGRLISGGQYGVRAAGAATVANLGTIRQSGTLAGGAGVAIGGIGLVTNGDGAFGAWLISGGDGVAIGGSGSVANDGTIVGSSDAGVSIRFGGSLTNGGTATHGAWISGNLYGVAMDRSDSTAASSAGVVGNFGTIAAAAATGIGVNLGHGGRVSNATAATILGGQYGVRIGGAASVSNLGTIRQTGSLAGGAGVATGGNAQIANGAGAAGAWLIAGSGGVAIGGTGTVTNTGTVVGSADAGISIRFGGWLVNGSTAAPGAWVSGNLYGVVIDRSDSTATGNSGTVTNFGTITAAAATGVGVELGNGGSVGNAAGQAVAGGQYGVRTLGATTVSNLGTIRQTGSLAGGAGIAIGGSGRVANGTGAAVAWLISGSDGIAFGGSGSVANAGTIVGSSDAGVSMRFGGGVANGTATVANAWINGNAYGVVIDRSHRTTGAVAGSVTNFGTISAAAATGIGVALGGGGGIANATGQTISGGQYGIRALGTTTVRNSGTIRQSSALLDGAGIQVSGTARVDNGGGTAGKWLISGGYGIAIVGRGTVTNAGTITGSSDPGVSIRFGGSVANGGAGLAGALISGTSFGVVIDHSGDSTSDTAGRLTNFGIIAATASDGVAVELENGGSVNNAGTIAGTTGVVMGGVGTLTNSGTVRSTAGAAGVAISFASRQSRLILRPGSVVVGRVIGGDAPAAGGIEVDAGATWTASGSIGAITNNGTVAVAAAADLHVGAVAAASSGVFLLSQGALLDIAAAAGPAERVAFLGGATLRLDAAQAGPTIVDFRRGDSIDIGHLLPAAATLRYAAGLLEVMQGGQDVATLRFDAGSLGAGAFHGAVGQIGHVVLTHW